MTVALQKKVSSMMTLSLAMITMISPADAQIATCTSTSPQCCWVIRIWQLMGKTTAVSPISSTDCCSSVVSSTGTTTIQNNGIPGVTCTSTGMVTKIDWKSNGLTGTVPPYFGKLVNLTSIDLSNNKGLNGAFYPSCDAYTKITNTDLTICGCPAKRTPPTTYPPADISEDCLASGTALTLEKRYIGYYQVIGEYVFTCTTDANKNPYMDCLNSMAEICNPTASTFSKTTCQTGVDQMTGQMNPLWQSVRRECGQWRWTDSLIGNPTSTACATANSNLRNNAYYTLEDGSKVSVTLDLIESINTRLWSQTALKG